MSCGTGIKNCDNEEASSGDGFDSDTQTECDADPRITWRALTVAIDLDGNRIWTRQDNYQSGTKSDHATVASSKGEYIFPVSGGKLGFISDEVAGFGIGVINAPDGNVCTETLNDVLPA